MLKSLCWTKVSLRSFVPFQSKELFTNLFICKFKVLSSVENFEDYQSLRYFDLMFYIFICFVFHIGAIWFNLKNSEKRSCFEINLPFIRYFFMTPLLFLVRNFILNSIVGPWRPFVLKVALLQFSHLARSTNLVSLPQTLLGVPVA